MTTKPAAAARFGLAAAALAMIFAFGPGAAPTAIAADSGAGTRSLTKVCPKGYVWSQPKNQCVQAQSRLVPDEEMIQQGRSLARAGLYEKAIAVLDAVEEKDALAFTYLGYSHRKMGDVDRGIEYYHTALAIDPDNLDTHEYLGEGYVAAGRTELARQELTTLASLCGTGCEQYLDLAAAIDGHPVD